VTILHSSKKEKKRKQGYPVREVRERDQKRGGVSISGAAKNATAVCEERTTGTYFHRRRRRTTHFNPQLNLNILGTGKTRKIVGPNWGFI